MAKVRKVEVMWKAIRHQLRCKEQGREDITIEDSVTHALEEFDVGYDLSTPQYHKLIADTDSACSEFIS